MLSKASASSPLFHRPKPLLGLFRTSTSASSTQLGAQSIIKLRNRETYACQVAELQQSDIFPSSAPAMNSINKEGKSSLNNDRTKPKPPHNHTKEGSWEATRFTRGSAAASETSPDLTVFLVVFDFSKLSLGSPLLAISLTESIKREIISSVIKIFPLKHRYTCRKRIPGAPGDLSPWPKRIPTPPLLEIGVAFKPSVAVNQLWRSLNKALWLWIRQYEMQRIQSIHSNVLPFGSIGKPQLACKATGCLQQGIYSKAGVAKLRKRSEGLQVKVSLTKAAMGSGSVAVVCRASICGNHKTVRI
ncbi:hypothetical protein FH972_015574 [Carpinus fangiana]|uniref:Uncharacterized protein n=1 Tax=Carpinus fangiana TaxID=176857 RepID=A0A5N6RFX5_9ROSI|nr:hypothetical protein FH972_015574 [Carpinus fangiana]